MHLTCSKCNHTIDLNPEFLNPDGSYYGRCSNCGFRLIKQPEKVEEQLINPVNQNPSIMILREQKKITLDELTTVLFVQVLASSFFALLLAWNNSKIPIDFSFYVILYMLWVVSVWVGGVVAVNISKIHHTALAGALSVFGTILGYLFHLFMLYLLSGADGDLPGFLTDRIKQGIIIEAYTRRSQIGGHLSVGGTMLLVFWVFESIFICITACLGAIRQAKVISLTVN